jgi:hypothetical protein
LCIALQNSYRIENSGGKAEPDFVANATHDRILVFVEWTSLTGWPGLAFAMEITRDISHIASPRHFSGTHSNLNLFREHSMQRRLPLILGTVAALATAAVLVNRRTQKTEQDNPPLGNFVEVDGIRLHYIERGEGRPVVLLHGNGTMAEE